MESRNEEDAKIKQSICTLFYNLSFTLFCFINRLVIDSVWLAVTFIVETCFFGVGLTKSPLFIVFIPFLAFLNNNSWSDKEKNTI